MYGYYEIKAGDTLSSIAREFQTDVASLAMLNQLTPMFVPKVGNRILVPLSAPSLFDYHEIKKGETLYQIARDNNTDLDNLAKLNGLNLNDYIYEGELLLIPKEGTSIYITKKGDTLNAITEKLNVSIEELISQNPTIYLLNDQLIIYQK